MIAIIDYDAGNIRSVENALIALGEEVVITRDPEILLQAEKVILPGVGAFGDAMEKLDAYGLVDVIHQIVEKKRLFRGLSENAYVYFVHSYYLQAEEEEIVKATTEYGVTIHASVEKDNVFACQFHPEKSSAVGRKILQNFLAINREDN